MTKIYDIEPILVDVPMPITTPRLLLRPPQKGDGKAMADMKRASWTELNKWMPFASGKAEDISDNEDEAVCRRKSAEFILREDIMMLAFDRATGNMVASSGLHRMNWKLRDFEIGYWVRSDETGKGIATEITNALTRYAFNALSANRVTIGHNSLNAASQRVIEKLGFLKEIDTKIDSIMNDGTVAGSKYYARYDLDGLPDLDVTWECEP